jgi:UDP-N-acetylmuramoyl-tripeptide--D-alanyl-D-alanine ligase
MQKISSAKVKEILSSPSEVAEITVERVSTDSRNVDEKSLFIALKGEKFDAHDFVKDVYQKGCRLMVVNRLIDGVPANNQLVVEDTLEAYGKIGAYNRSLFKGTVIGLTGSSGKTTTREEIAFLLSKFAPTYSTSGNHNNFVGVPQSLCELDMSAKYAVLEMGMSAKGEISKLTDMVKPDIAIVTNVYPMHIEFFENFEGIAHAKAEIFEGLKEGGIAIINEDTNFAEILIEAAKKRAGKIITFGKNHHPQADFQTQENGEHHLYNAWCALSVVEALGLDVKKAASYIKDFGALEGRGKKHTLALKDGTYTLIDDSYSGQPEAMMLAIKSLGESKTAGRKIAVLGKMGELGATSKTRHHDVGKCLAENQIDIVIGVGEETKNMLAELNPDAEQYYFENKDGLTDFLLEKILQKDDIVLIKGSHYASKLFQVAAELIKRGEHKK